jgi:hypothetical protein
MLQVHTARGELVFGADAYSSWEGLRDWKVANIQQTDTIQQFLAYEKCYVLTAPSGNSVNNCLAPHERVSYSDQYPITSNWWTIRDGNCSRAAELALAPGEPSHVPADVATGTTSVNGQTVLWRIDATTCQDTVAIVPPHTPQPSSSKRSRPAPARRPAASAGRPWIAGKCTSVASCMARGHRQLRASCVQVAPRVQPAPGGRPGALGGGGAAGRDAAAGGERR